MLLEQVSSPEHEQTQMWKAELARPQGTCQKTQDHPVEPGLKAAELTAQTPQASFSQFLA